jgi:uncharacterized protein (TIGR02246 family)
VKHSFFITGITFLAGLAAGFLLRSGNRLPPTLLAQTGQGPANSNAAKSHAEISGADQSGIDQLRQEDIRATLSGDAHQLANLWDEDGVLMAPQAPTLIGKKAIEQELQKDKEENPESKPVAYKPQWADLQMAGDWAFEYGSFEARTQDNAQKQPTSFQGRFLRVMKRQSDGSWKFSRIMWNLPAKSPAH